MNALKSQKSNKVVIEKENKKEIDTLKIEKYKINRTFNRKSRPSSFDEIIGQENGIKALKAAICSPNPQHVIIYGPPGTGKTAAARLILEDAKKKNIPHLINNLNLWK